MKKFASLLMVLSLTAFSVGCGKKEDPKPAPPAPAHGDAEVDKKTGSTDPAPADKQPGVDEVDPAKAGS